MLNWLKTKKSNSWPGVKTNSVCCDTARGTEDDEVIVIMAAQDRWTNDEEIRRSSYQRWKYIHGEKGSNLNFTETEGVFGLKKLHDTYYAMAAYFLSKDPGGRKVTFWLKPRQITQYGEREMPTP